MPADPTLLALAARAEAGGDAGLSLAQESALALLQAISDSQSKLDEINRRARELYGDFTPHLSLIADCVYGEVVKLLDAVLGDGNANYLLHEATFMNGRAFVQEIDGRKWPLNTVADLRAELSRAALFRTAAKEPTDG